MTTETPPVDPITEAWSDRLEEDLVEAGMETDQARAYRFAFELGLTRVISHTATRQELKDGLTELRQEMREMRDDLRGEMREMVDGLRGEMRFLFLVFGGVVTALLSAILAIVA